MLFNLSTEDIYNFITKDTLMLKCFGGVNPLDKLPNNIQLGNFYIINSDPAELPGEHWICVFFPRKSHPEFFDSLGRNPSSYSAAITDFMGDEYVYNSVKFQPQDSATCGLYCLYFLYHRIRNNSYIDIICRFSGDLQHNDSIVIDFYRNFPL
jgi:hypothetical protein